MPLQHVLRMALKTVCGAEVLHTAAGVSRMDAAPEVNRVCGCVDGGSECPEYGQIKH
jgi:hypothetical protein